jgi:FkbM family methyltransferase
VDKTYKKQEFNANLIFDLGFHKGEDTAYYLKKGYKVVAVEADFDLYSEGMRNFHDYVESDQLNLIHAAVINSGRKDETILFYPNKYNSQWGTTDLRWVRRNSQCFGLSHLDPVRVPVTNLVELTKEFGIPYFIKIDLEGSDEEVLLDLQNCKSLPKYVSWETGKESYFSVVNQHYQLIKLGYTRFKVLQQSYMHKKVDSKMPDGGVFHFSGGSSGTVPSENSDKWNNFGFVVFIYALLFIGYIILGPKSLFFKASQSKNKFVNNIPKRIQQYLSKKEIPFPGWYDSHAMRIN